MIEGAGKQVRTVGRRILGVMLRAVGLLLFCAAAHGDANDGEYLGFRLGDHYPVPPGVAGKPLLNGALHYAVNPEHRHQHMGSMSLYVSPGTHTIGSIFGEWYFTSKRSAEEFSRRYKRSLDERYSHWRNRRNYLTDGVYQLWVDVEQRPPFADFWRLDKPFRVSVALIYWPDSAQRAEWLARLERESGQRELVANK